MSLTLTPSSAARPLPPSRSKRVSAASPCKSPSPLPHDEVVPLPDPNTLSCLASDREARVARASRDELALAIQEEWEERDKLMTRIQELEDAGDEKDIETRELMRALGTLQSRSDIALNEQSRLEADLEARDEVLERVRARLTMAEREVRDVQARYNEQERSFEAERSAFQAQEAHLQSRIRTMTQSLTLARSSTNNNPTHNAPSTHPAEWEDELASLRVSHTTLLAQLNTLSGEVHELRSENVRLKEENEGWEYLVRERTFSGQMIKTFSSGSSATAMRNRARLDAQAEAEAEADLNAERAYEEGKSQLEVLDEELELEAELDAEMGELASDLEAQTPTMMGDESRRKSRGYSRIVSPGAIKPIGQDLATELGIAGEERPEDEQDKVRVENRELKEEIKALQLYCSKILDRIISQDGFEHVLSVDYKTRRMGKSASAKTSIQEVMQTMHSPDEFGIQPKASAIEDKVQEKEGGKQQEAESKADKRARRGFSLDFRNFGFGATSSSNPSTPSTELKPALRPLTLVATSSTRSPDLRVPPMPIASSASASATQTPTQSQRQSPNPSTGRKLEPHIEDEEDRRERSRLEAALKLMGIDKPASPNIHSPLSLSAGTSPILGPSDTGSASVPKPPNHRKLSNRGTPFSRLSSALGFSPTPLPAHPDPDTNAVQAALKELDAKDQHQARLLSKGKAEVGYTSPPKPVQRTISKSESISTLWSVGSGGGSRPVSMEVAK